MFTSEDQIVAALLSANIEEQVAQRLAKQARPCVWLKTESVTDEAEIAIGTTKIGGRPDLPAGLAWPIRPPYAPGERAARYRAQIANPKSWSWATPEKQEEFRRGYEQRLDVIGRSFPLVFIAQINLADTWHANRLDPDFPKSGLLSIFYDALEAPWGFDPTDHVGCQVLFHAPDTAPLTRRELPTELTAMIGDAPFAPLRCLSQACLTPLPIETAQFESLNIDEETVGVIQEWWGADDNMYSSEDGMDWKCHRVGGWPTPVQGDMQTECALVAAGYYCGNGDAYRAAETEAVRATAREWLLLAQIGTDAGAQMMWGDNGQLYVWIRRQDLVARRFEAARLILQCY